MGKSMSQRSTQRHGRIPAGLLAIPILAAGLLAYANSFHGVFVFDDIRTIVHNEHIRRLWPPWTYLTGERGLVEFSLALNYAAGGLDVRGYHAVNLAIHLLAALCLFGLVRRTLVLAARGPATRRTAPWMALATALLWVVHPLQTESVTYVTQRAESLVSLFYLLTVYAMVRGAASRRPGWWYAAAIAACSAGTRSKPVIVTAPLVALLYDRTFLSGSFSGAWHRRRWLHLGLGATWLLLAGTIRRALDPDLPGVVAGFGYKGIRPGEYLVTQAGVIVHYLKLAVWPRELCIDYKWPVAKSVAEVFFPGLLVLALLVLTAWALRHRPRLGFLGASFFLVLAPTSSVIPIRDVAVEHRMYLALAGVIVLAVVAAAAALRRVGDARARAAVAASLVLTAASLLGYRTVQRNRDYHSEIAFWKSVALQRPHNYRAINNVGWALERAGRKDEAVPWFRRSLEINPRYYWAHYNLAVILAERGDAEGAIRHYRAALRSKPDLADAHWNLAGLLASLGRKKEAAEHFRVLTRIRKGTYSREQLGRALMRSGEYARAARVFEEALRLDPGDAQAHVNLGAALAMQGDIHRAVEHYRAALRIDPLHATAHSNLGLALSRQGRFAEAVPHYRQALRIKPDWGKVRLNLARALRRLHRLDEAVAAYQAVLRQDPDLSIARRELEELVRGAER